MTTSALLPVPGLVLGHHPQRTVDDAAAVPLPGLLAALQGLPLWHRARLRGLSRQAAQVRQLMDAAPRVDAPSFSSTLKQARAGMAASGLRSPAALQALALAGAASSQVLGRVPRDAQLMTALTVLNGELAELPTGEGKTLCAALAAATAAMAGVPVHVVTANDYLAGRDGAALAPFYAALGLRVAAVREGMAREDKRAVYAAPVVYASAKELAFDHLRDTLLPPPAPQDGPEGAGSGRLLPGLCLAVLDEADSLLLDEAQTPLVLSESDGRDDRLAMCRRALAIARRLEPEVHFRMTGAGRAATLLPAGQAVVGSDDGEPTVPAVPAVPALWRLPRYREELVALALQALHGLQRDRHYLVRNAQIQLIDANTGRVSEGRAWSHGLQQLVELKEGCPPSPANRVLAQTTFQDFFSRYLHVGGMSGTLVEARAELLEIYGLSVVQIPPARPSRLTLLPPRVFTDAQSRWNAVLADIEQRHARGQPLLIGTASVEQSETLSQRLRERGLPHTVLNARHDRQEAALVAAAGAPGAITVSTNMAGRGTDVELGAAALALGGLHVIACQSGSSRRVDRQLSGRAGRQGQPGSAQAMLSLAEGPLHRLVEQGGDRPLISRLAQGPSLAPWLARSLVRITHLLEEHRARRARRALWLSDRLQRRLHLPGLPE